MILWVVRFNDDAYYFTNEAEAREAAGLVAANNIANPDLSVAEPITFAEFQDFMEADYGVPIDDKYDDPAWGVEPRGIG